jgi:hypothetical protein
MAEGWDGNTTVTPAWKAEVASLPSLQIFAFMQPGDTFVIVCHTLVFMTYSTNLDVLTYNENVVLFTGDRHGGRNCTPRHLRRVFAVVMLASSLSLRWRLRYRCVCVVALIVLASSPS